MKTTEFRGCVHSLEICTVGWLYFVSRQRLMYIVGRAVHAKKQFVYKMYTQFPVFTILRYHVRPTNHWMFEAQDERSTTRRQHCVPPPHNRMLNFEVGLIMGRLAKLYAGQNLNCVSQV